MRVLKCASWLTKRHDDGSKVAVAGYGTAGIVGVEVIFVLVPELT
jgi:hypothetical protein